MWGNTFAALELVRARVVLDADPELPIAFVVTDAMIGTVINFRKHVGGTDHIVGLLLSTVTAVSEREITHVPHSGIRIREERTNKRR
jgi:hypothetical protein